jgi:para-aminobenzoate synthetase component 1
MSRERSVQTYTLPYTQDTLTLADQYRHLPYFLLLDSGHLGPDVFSAVPLEWLSQPVQGQFSHNILQSDGSYVTAQSQGNLEQELKRLHATLTQPAAPESVWQPSIMGLLSYEAGYESNFIGPLLQNGPLDTALSQCGSYVWAIVVNHDTKTTQLCVSDQCPEWLATQVMSLQTAPTIGQPLGDEPSITQPFEPFRLTQTFTPHTTATQYQQDIERILNYINAGDCYQVNYTQKFSAPCTGDAWQAFKLLRKLSETPFGAFLDTGNEQVLSHSPERFIQISQGTIATQPIKGTIKRGQTPEEDHDLAQQLRSSSKDRAENVMIVDLLRNDVGKSSVPGSVKVPHLFNLESYRNVHHLVSTVTAQLLPGLSPIEGFLRAFPGGSITGAPKKRAMEIIHALEPHQRGPYCGSLFYWDSLNTLDSNILIRTLVVKAGHISVWGGGGIVADSDPLSEYEESLTKVGYLMAALEAQTLNIKF